LCVAALLLYCWTIFSMMAESNCNEGKI
jgi:hypothetical protein